MNNTETTEVKLCCHQKRAARFTDLTFLLEDFSGETFQVFRTKCFPQRNVFINLFKLY